MAFLSEARLSKYDDFYTYYDHSSRCDVLVLRSLKWWRKDDHIRIARICVSIEGDVHTYDQAPGFLELTHQCDQWFRNKNKSIDKDEMLL